MGNDCFRFKQFTVFHNKCAMKVGTDGVLLGAWSGLAPNGGRILDIGCGSGLIALILAQKNPNSLLDAVEINRDCASQAVENVKNSPYHNRIKVYNDSFQNFSKSALRYDLIVTNPPYFSKSLLPVLNSRAKARHTESLTHEELLKGVSSILNPQGIFSVIIPYDILDYFISKAVAYCLNPLRLCYVCPTSRSSPKRTLLEFSFLKKELKTEDLIIEEFGRHKYSEKYISLTKDFYLKF